MMKLAVGGYLFFSISVLVYQVIRRKITYQDLIIQMLFSIMFLIATVAWNL